MTFCVLTNALRYGIRNLQVPARRDAVKIKIAQKDIPGYVFLLILAAGCIAIGARVLHNHHPASGIFSLAVGAGLVIAGFSMVLRKD
jgi:hypothetical protein